MDGHVVCVRVCMRVCMCSWLFVSVFFKRFSIIMLISADCIWTDRQQVSRHCDKNKVFPSFSLSLLMSFKLSASLTLHSLKKKKTLSEMEGGEDVNSHTGAWNPPSSSPPFIIHAKISLQRKLTFTNKNSHEDTAIHFWLFLPNSTSGATCAKISCPGSLGWCTARNWGLSGIRDQPELRRDLKLTPI